MKTWWKKDLEEFTPNVFQSGNVAGGDQYINSTVSPAAGVITLDSESVKKYLKSKGCVLWMNWHITSEDGLEDAANWLSSEFSNFVVFTALGDEELEQE